MSKPVRVVLADDSPTIRHYLSSIMVEMNNITIIGEARNGQEVVELVRNLQPDVVSMDINMPKMDGLEATRQIMAEIPTPVVVVSGLVESDVELSMRALEAGALAVVEKPPDRDNPLFEEKRKRLITAIRAMAGVSVVSRRYNHRAQSDENLDGSLRQTTTDRLRRPEIIAIGASTGGPSAIHRILRDFPADLSVPVVIVQHMPHEFLQGMARWLQRSTDLQVKIADAEDELKAGYVYIAPGTSHMTVKRQDAKLVVQLIRERGTPQYQPSINMLFNSIATINGSNAIGVILTGMGDDGASGLLAMKQASAKTLAQDENSSTVYGMPNAAVLCGAVKSIVPLTSLASEILKMWHGSS
jgi:two-component system, chemotaxis family, protein-glutamate methylesterase/glutaminase